MKKLNNIDLDLLPQGLRDIAELIGVASTLKIVEAFGGTRLWIPLKFDKKHQLIKVIGISKAKLLWETYQGERIVVDKAQAALRALRNQEIINKLATHSRASLALEYQLTEKTIYQIQREHNQNDDQLSFF